MVSDQSGSKLEGLGVATSSNAGVADFPGYPDPG